MKKIALDLPEIHEKRIVWLEDLLVHGELARFVADLLILQDRSLSDYAAKSSPASLSAEQLDRFLENGLKTFSENELRILIQNPELLFDLQTIALESESSYWNEKFISSVDEDINAQQRLKFTDFLESKSKSNQVELDHRGEVSTSRNSMWISKPLRALAALAAAILVLFAISNYFNQGNNIDPLSSVSWANSGVLIDENEPVGFLEELAAIAEQFSKKEPSNSKEMTKFLRAFRTDCEALRDSKLQQLTSNTDKIWLRNRCTSWLKRVNRQLDLLASNGEFESVFNNLFGEQNGLMPSLIKSLESRAELIRENSSNA